MKKTTIYRADNYMNNMGDFLGFYETKEEAKEDIDFSNEVPVADGNFSQITEFKVNTSDFVKGELSDSEFIMELWSEGEVVNDFYFK